MAPNSTSRGWPEGVSRPGVAAQLGAGEEGVSLRHVAREQHAPTVVDQLPRPLFGFVEVEQLLFGERSQVVVDPSEESLKKEFEGVRRFHVPIHSIVRVDEVEKEGQARVSENEKGTDNVASFPVPIYTPGGEPGK